MRGQKEREREGGGCYEVIRLFHCENLKMVERSPDEMLIEATRS